MANLILHKRMSIAQYNTFKTLHTVNGVLDDEFKNTLFVLNETGTFTGTSDCIFYMGEHLISYASYKKALSLSASSTDNQFPTARCVYDAVKNKADSATTLSGYGITDAYTKTEVDSRLTTVYKAAGSAATVSALGSLDAQHEGFVYNMSAEFETTSNFIEGAGKSYPVGTNVVIVNTGTNQSPVYKYDILAGEIQKLSINITWQDLKALRDSSLLVPGMQYRITDYTCTTTQADTQSAGNVFDIIVRADSSSVLNENAYAAHHNGDTYFQYNKLEAWELKYCIDNDTDRFAWADDTNGKGVIFYMKDEFGNECGYDFKNILMKFYKITAVTTVPYYLNNTYSISKVIGTNNYTITSGCTVDANDTEFRYTFDLYSSNTHSDHSLNTASSNKAKFCYDNVITPMYGFTDVGNTTNNKKMWINFISFRNADNANGCFGNKFSALNINMSFGDTCFSNTFGNACYSNTFGNYCEYNTFGNACNSNIFEESCMFNTFGDGCTYNTFKVSCNSNIFGDSCSSNKFGNNCYSNTFGYGCFSNEFGNTCNSNTFGNNCYGNILEGDDFSNNTFGDECSNNTFGDICSCNTFGDDCQYIKFGNFCSYNTFGNGCQYIKFGDSSSVKSYYEGIIVENRNKYIYLNTTQTTSYSNKIRNVKIAQGVNNTTTYKTISHNTVGDTFQTIYQPVNSQIISI